MNFNTRLLQNRSVERYADGATLPPITQSNAFGYESMESLERVFSHQSMGYAYTRIGNPTVASFSARLNELEEGAGTVAVSSGMAAIAAALLCILSPGDEIIAGSGLYGGTLDLLDDLEKIGIHTRFAGGMTPGEIAPLITPRTRVLFGEVISNPALRVMDIAKTAELAHAHALPLIVDSTTATPYLVRALSLGADIVIHSSSKYINGSGDAISGAIVDGGRFSWDESRFPALRGFGKYGKLAFQARLRMDICENLGCCLSPMNAFLNVIGLETLGIRMERICTNAAALARALHEEGIQVNYPALPDSPYADLCGSQLEGMGGGILTFRAGSVENASEILGRLRYARIASNIGDVRTLVIRPASTLFLKSTKEQRREAGVYDDTIRVSVGIEDSADLLEDFLQAVRGI